MTTDRRVRDEMGQGALALVAVVVVLVVAVALLVRTTVLATEIDAQAETIANNGTGINDATASIIRLDETNGFGKSILETAKPLEGQLNQVIGIAQSIDGTATGITNNAVTINGTARGINGTAATILDTARSINRGVESINRNVDETIRIVQAIQADTANIVIQGEGLVNNGACIDRGLNGGAVDDGHCQ